VQGWHVFGTVRREADGEGLRTALDQLAAAPGGAVQPVIMDVTDEASVQRAVSQVASACGERGLNALINNAGIARFGPLELLGTDVWRTLFEVWV
jgi:NAD(P)-dependent dehydrogenase (short-subunit alcohol dehydrogenase family)